MSDFNSFYKKDGYKPKTQNQYGSHQGGARFKDEPVPDNYTIYSTVAFFAERDTPGDKINEMIDIMKDVVSAGYIVRYTGHGQLVQAAEEIPSDKKEIYIPWRGFADIDSKFRFNDNLSMHEAAC